MKIKNKNIVIFASGSGSNAVKIHDHFKEVDNINIASLHCNNPKAGVLQKFRELNVKTFLFSKKDLDNQNVLESLLKIDPDLIVLAGFLLKIPKSITSIFKNKIINIHPSLLPLYGGKGMFGENIHKAVINNKEKTSGLTIHYVNEKYDDGAIIFQKQVELDPFETSVSLSKKILKEEHLHYPIVIEKTLVNDQ